MCPWRYRSGNNSERALASVAVTVANNKPIVVNGRITGSFKMLPESLYFWEIRNSSTFHHIFFKTVPLCNYTILPVTVKVWETFLEVILWKPFQLFRHILNDVNSITKAPPPLFDDYFSWRNSQKSTAAGSGQYGGCSSVVMLFFLRNPWPKPTGVLEHCRDGETNCWFSIFLGVSFWPHPWGDEGCQFTVLYSE